MDLPPRPLISFGAFGSTTIGTGSRSIRRNISGDLYQPMLALADAVREKFQIEGTVLKTSRIYRDVRYSGGIPYKEHLWFCIRQDNVFWSEHPSMYFRSSRRAAALDLSTMPPRRR